MVFSAVFKEALAAVVESPVLWDAPLQAWTTFRIGGPADALVTPDTAEQLMEVLALCRQEEIDWTIIGRGSNILAADEGYRGVVIVLGEGFKTFSRLEGCEKGPVRIRAGAAATLTRLTDWAMEQSGAGLEFAAGIPGSVGGAVAMNAGAWGDEMSGVVESIELVSHERRVQLPGSGAGFSYRCLKDLSGRYRGFVITMVDFSLKKSTPEKIRGRMRELRNRRAGSQPAGMPNAGSFFKNPFQESAGKLIDEAGLKGLRIGDAEVSREHANFFVNRGGATAADVKMLMREVQARVKQNSGILLEPEVHFL